MNTDLLLASVVRKIVTGKTDWTSEELQYQKNNPQEIESALFKERLRTSVKCDYEGIMVIPYKWNLSIMQRAKKDFNVRRFLFTADAVALALYHNVNMEGHVCILTDDAESIEIGIFVVGDGVFEPIYAHWILKKDEDSLPIVCNSILHDSGFAGNMSQIVFARKNPDCLREHHLESVFQRPVLQVANLTDLCNLGASVMHGVLQGDVKDVILLQLIPQTIGISDTEGSMLPIIEANTVIPAKRTVVVRNAGAELAIRQGNNPVASQNPIIATLHFKDGGFSQSRQIEVSVEIDANYGCRFFARDMVTGEFAHS